MRCGLRTGLQIRLRYKSKIGNGQGSVYHMFHLTGRVIRYACRDSDATLRLYPILKNMQHQVRRTTQEHWGDRTGRADFGQRSKRLAHAGYGSGGLDKDGYGDVCRRTPNDKPFRATGENKAHPCLCPDTEVSPSPLVSRFSISVTYRTVSNLRISG